MIVGVDIGDCSQVVSFAVLSAQEDCPVTIRYRLSVVPDADVCQRPSAKDAELEVATIYAEKLGFRSSLVGDLVKSIVTEDSDDIPIGNVRQQVLDFMELNETGS